MNPLDDLMIAYMQAVRDGDAELAAELLAMADDPAALEELAKGLPPGAVA